jgi:hypothetical protein
MSSQQTTGSGSRQVATEIRLPERVVIENCSKGFANFIVNSKSGDTGAAKNFLFALLHQVSRFEIASTVSTRFTQDPPYLTRENQIEASKLMIDHLRNPLIVDACQRGISPPLTPYRPIRLRQDSVDECDIAVTMLVPTDVGVIGTLIGKNGTTISQLEEQYSVVIRIEAIRKGMYERPVKISGTVKAITLAQESISRIVQQKMIEGGIHVELLKIVVEDRFVPHFIGQSGQTIKEIEKISGTRIQVLPQDKNVTSFDRIITFQGIQKCRTYALYLTVRAIYHHACMNLSVKRNLRFS